MLCYLYLEAYLLPFHKCSASVSTILNYFFLTESSIKINMSLLRIIMKEHAIE